MVGSVLPEVLKPDLASGKASRAVWSPEERVQSGVVQWALWSVSWWWVMTNL